MQAYKEWPKEISDNLKYPDLIILIYKGEKIYQNEEEKMNAANRFKCNNLLARQQCFYKSFFQKYHILSRYNIYHHASHYRVIYFLFIIFILD